MSETEAPEVANGDADAAKDETTTPEPEEPEQKAPPAAAAKPAAKKAKEPKEPKKKAPAKKTPKKPATHPKYSEMIREALLAIKERGGTSRQAILKFIMKKYNTGHDEKTVNLHLKMALRAGVRNGTLLQSKGTGASGSFKLGDKNSGATKTTAKHQAKSPAKKASTPKPAQKKKKTKKAKVTAEKKPKKATKKAKAAKKAGGAKKGKKTKKAAA